MRNSYDSGNRPLTNVQYQNANNPYNTGGGYTESSQYLPNAGVRSKKRGVSNWIKFGIPILVIIIAGAVVGGIIGSKKSHASTSSSSTAGGSSNPAAASSAVANKNQIGVFPTSTDSYELPVYPTTNNAAYVQPTFVSGASSAWPTDTFQAPSNPTPTNVRNDRPRLIAPKVKFDALASIVPNDPYMSQWNATIIQNATDYKNAALVPYTVDGGPTLSGYLDVARQVKERIKAYAYAFRVTQDQTWVQRAWTELQHAAGNSSQPFGVPGNPDIWNSQHFLDLAEFTAAFAIGYDWLNDQWTADQKNSLMWSIINLGLNYGVQAYNGASFGWWNQASNGKGNWNCVCNSGLTLGALAILGDDPTGTASKILGLTVPNAAANCATAPTTDGSWTETANYWYFGTMAHAEMTSSLMVSSGSDYGMLNKDANFKDTGMFHMYVTGMTSLFNWGDHGPNKYSTNADAMLFYGDQYQHPEYTLFQRDRFDVNSDPWAMLWYDPTVAGAWWDNLPLDHFFDDPLTQWASMRTSWTDNSGAYVAIKSGQNSGALHQNHNDLDVGDFVLDAMGQRWAGELGSGDYDADGYFNGTEQDDPRWTYYRKKTEGQNTLLIGGANQLITSSPSVKHGSTGEAQTSDPSYAVPSTSTAWFTTDMTSAYSGVTSVKRGIRFINGRKQILLQDEVNTGSTTEWRMHTNATVTFPSNTQATLTLGGQTLQMTILSPTSGAQFSQGPAQRSNNPPALEGNSVDQPNPGVTVVSIDLPAGTNTLEVLFNPQWSGMAAGDFKTPPSVPLDSWTNTSHD